ncbi:class I SAM-dependent methyltransferase [Pseudoruegeria sp. HB172150]|uniref:class I SAM-dependent methyltransferase n=1 Tax=Pseudoruegeria sp. HB172150 TaxID=2721164 RepID=UPI0015557EF8|nr:SAM-dependent methyltransferase [Pseudoruegeria sp. HB172150]
MTPLAESLIRRIGATGPITIAEYMTDCLLHPEHGYYSTRDPFGAGGDFTTAPEISQMFGELIGLALAQAWLDQGAPTPFTLAELGPGRGTLMADLLRATRDVPGFHAAARVHLVEASPTLRERQKQTLETYEITWCGSADNLPDAPLFLIANEFFDALPIRQFVRDEGGWRERQVALIDGQLALALSTPAPIAELDHRLGDTRPGDLVETCAPARAVMQAIASRVAGHGGAALVIDYGDWRSLGDTLQALRGHQSENPLASPGDADLTAHVDFEALAKAATGLAHTAMTPQGVFLERLGITPRAQALARNLQGKALEAHIAAHRRLTHPDEMGSLFKTIAFHSTETSAPPGLQG